MPSELVSLTERAQEHRCDGRGAGLERGALMGSSETEAERERKARLKGVQGTLDSTSHHLSSAVHLLSETEQVATSTADKLVDQTGSLERTRGHVSATQAHADEARLRVADIRARAWTNKCLLGFSILLLLAANVAVLLYGHILHKSSATPSK
jgi:hypothetical protein